MENQEALEAGAAVSDAANLVEDAVDQLLANGVVATGVVVRGILLASNHVLGVEQASVWAGPDLIDDVGLEIAVDGSRDILALACPMLDTVLTGSSLSVGRGRGKELRTGLGEEGAEAVVRVLSFALVGQVAIGL